MFKSIISIEEKIGEDGRAWWTKHDFFSVFRQSQVLGQGWVIAAEKDFGATDRLVGRYRSLIHLVTRVCASAHTYWSGTNSFAFGFQEERRHRDLEEAAASWPMHGCESYSTATFGKKQMGFLFRMLFLIFLHYLVYLFNQHLPKFSEKWQEYVDLCLQNMLIHNCFKILMLKSPTKMYVHHWLSIWREHHVNVVWSDFKSYCLQILWRLEQWISNFSFSISDVRRIQGQHQGYSRPRMSSLQRGSVVHYGFHMNIISNSATCIYLCILLLHGWTLFRTYNTTSVCLKFYFLFLENKCKEYVDYVA